MQRTVISAIILFGVCAGVALLQIFLSKKENKWAGLVLPFISLSISLLAALGAVMFIAVSSTTTSSADGVIVQETVRQINTSAVIGMTVYIFAIFNIPTAFLLAIYAACRGKSSRRRALEKMSIQDLE